MAKMIYRKDTGDILGVHIFGLHAADLIHEASNAIATGQRVQVTAATLSPPCCDVFDMHDQECLVNATGQHLQVTAAVVEIVVGLLQ